MSAGGMSLDPEIEQILRDVASDPNSMLLRVDRPEKWRGLFQRKERARRGEPYTTLAERELLDFHREQVAELLYQVGSWLFVNAPKSRAFRCFTDRAALSADVQRLEGLDSHGDIAEALLMASRGVSLADMGGSPTPLQFAQSSYRLRPSQRAVILAALALQHSGQHQASEEVARSIVRPDSNAVRAHRDECLALNRFDLGDFLAAASCYRSSHETGAGLPAGPVFWFFNVLLVADAAQYLPAQAAALESLQTVPELGVFLMESARSTLADGTWVRTRHRTEFCRARLASAPEVLAPVLRWIMEGADA